MSDYKHHATAAVQLTVDVELGGGGWGGECTVGQVHEQGAREARSALENVLREANRLAGFTKFSIKGRPVVLAVTAIRAPA